MKLRGHDPDGNSFYPSVLLQGVKVDLHLTGSVTSVGQTASHIERTTLTTDVNGNVLIFTNSHIQGLYTLQKSG